MGIFLHIITHNIVPIFFLIATGTIIGMKFNLDVGTLSKLVFYAFSPAFAFVVIYSSDLSVNMWRILLFVSVLMIISTGLSFAAAGIRRMNSRKKHIMVNSIIFYNSGNIGIPLITLIYVNTPYLAQALVIQVTIMLAQSFTMNTIGFYNAGRGDLHWKDSALIILKMPIIYAIGAAMIFKQFNLDLQQTFIWPAFLYMKQAMIGFVLVTLGVQLSKTKFSGSDPDVIIAVAIRLIGGPLTALLILKAAGINGFLGQVLFVSSAMPTAVNAALIAIERNVEPDFAAKTVMFSTIACSVSLVLVVYFSRILFPV